MEGFIYVELLIHTIGFTIAISEAYYLYSHHLRRKLFPHFISEAIITKLMFPHNRPLYIRYVPVCMWVCVCVGDRRAAYQRFWPAAFDEWPRPLQRSYNNGNFARMSDTIPRQYTKKN